MKKTILIIALVAITQSDKFLVHAKPNNQNGNTFFGFQFQPFQAKFDGHASYVNGVPAREEGTTAETTTAGYATTGNSYYETIGARSGFKLNGEFDNNFNIFKIGQDIKQTVEQIFQDIAQNVEQKITNAKNYAKVLGENLKALIENYQYRVLRGSFAALKVTLESVSQSADIVQATSQKVQQNLEDQVTQVDNELMEGVADWSSTILDRLAQRTDNNEWAQTQAQEKINVLINRYGAFQESCKEEAYAELKTYQENINTAVEKIEVLQDRSLTVIQSCIAPSSNPYDCVRDINVLIRDLRLSIYALRNLNVEGVRLSAPGNAYGRRSCVVQNSQELQLERIAVEIEIEVIRRQAADHPNTTATPTNPGSDQTTENPNQGSSAADDHTTESPAADQTTENPNQGSSAAADQTTDNSNQGSSPASDETTENPNQGSSPASDETTENPNQGSSPASDETTENPIQGSSSASDETTENTN